MKGILYIVFLFLVSSCSLKIQDASLPVDEPLAHFGSAEMNYSIPVLSYNKNGVFYDKNSDISKWWSSWNENIVVGKNDASMMIDLKEVGNGWETLAMDFKPIDFTGGEIFQIKARLDPSSIQDSLKIMIWLIDEDGNTANAGAPSRIILKRDEFKTYKFSFVGKWMQGSPFPAEVNRKRITSMRIFFNPGGPNYRGGRLIIDEFIAIEGQKKIENPNNYVFEDFSDGNSGWWSGNRFDISAYEDGPREVLKLKLTNVGPGWEGMGKTYGATFDFNKTPILQMKLKADNPGRFNLILFDVDKVQMNVVKEFPASDDYVDVYFDFSEKIKSSGINGAKINGGNCYINPPDSPPYSGTILIDEWRLLSEEEYEKQTGLKSELKNGINTNK